MHGNASLQIVLREEPTYTGNRWVLGLMKRGTNVGLYYNMSAYALWGCSVQSIFSIVQLNLNWFRYPWAKYICLPSQATDASAQARLNAAGCVNQVWAKKRSTIDPITSQRWRWKKLYIIKYPVLGWEIRYRFLTISFATLWLSALLPHFLAYITRRLIDQ